jgi:hypothetical protein
MFRLSLLLPALLVAASACAPAERLYLPEGDEVAGREAFEAMRCYVCHAVPGETFPEPHATPAVPVELGSSLALRTRAELAESVIAPSHEIPAFLPDVRHGDLSRMGDYGDAMTVRQWLDIVSYLESLGSRYRIPEVRDVPMW